MITFALFERICFSFWSNILLRFQKTKICILKIKMQILKKIRMILELNPYITNLGNNNISFPGVT